MEATLIAAVIAATVSVISLFVQWRLTINNNEQIRKIEEKKLHAEIIAKSRIDWIQKVRGLMSEYITIAHLIMFELEKLEAKINSKSELVDTDEKEAATKEINISILELNENTLSMNQIHNSLLLYFSNNTGNKKIVEEINKVSQHVTQMKSNVYKDSVSVKTNKDCLKDLRDVSRDYFKEEWENVKNI